MYNIYIICISLRMRVHVCVRHLPTDCDRINRSSFENYSIRFFISLQKPIPLLSFVSFNGFNSPFGFFHQPNDARKRANYWPRDTCAISYGATFLPNVPILSSPCSWKRKLPENCRSKSDRGHGKTFLFFFFFLLPFSTLIRERKKKQKKNPKRAKFFNSFENRKSGEREFKSDLECIRRESAIGRQSCNRFYLFYFGRLRIVHRYTSIYRLHLTHATYT